jgi:4'-phosphopantetheinyl transferase
MAELRSASDLLRLARSAELAANDIHVWRISVTRCSDTLLEFEALLDPEERQRAARFVFADSRSQFTIARASLRLILGGYLRQGADALRFVYGRYGKPALAGTESLRFNVAHSEDAVLIAVARGFDIGVDVELYRNVDPEELAPQCLDSEEIGRMRSLSPAKRRVAFFEYWTSKEALSKAVGCGLNAPLTAIHVCDASDRVVEMTWGSEAGAERWFAYRLDVGPDYSAAVAARSPSHRVALFGTDSAYADGRTTDEGMRDKIRWPI